MPSDISRKMIVTSFGSSTGVRNLTMLAAPAMPNARASESPMMIIIIAPETHSRICACCMARPVGRSVALGACTAVTRMPMSAAATSLTSAMNGCVASASAAHPGRPGRSLGIAGQRPAESAPDQRRTQHRPRARPDQVPAQFVLLRGIDRVVDDEHMNPASKLRGSTAPPGTDRQCGTSRRAAEPRCARAPGPGRRGCRSSAHDAGRPAGRSSRCETEPARAARNPRPGRLRRVPPGGQHDATADRILSNGHVKG